MKTAGKIAVGFFLLGVTMGLTASAVVISHLFNDDQEEDGFGIVAENYYWN